jgi:hypothetical protein
MEDELKRAQVNASEIPLISIGDGDSRFVNPIRSSIRIPVKQGGVPIACASSITDSQLITPIDGPIMVGMIEEKETVDLKLCNACQAEMRERDRFCRRCGVRYSGDIAPAVTKDDWPDWLTVANTGSLTPLRMTASPEEESSYRPFSGPLAKAVAAGVSTGPLTLSYSPLVKKITLGLITIPIWLIIILLSPFDAYATAKSVSTRIRFN